MPMQTEDTNRPINNHGRVILIVVIALAFNFTVGVTTLAATLFWNKEVNVALLTAFVAIINFCAGALAGLLANPRSNQVQDVKVTNPPHDAANVEVQPT